MKENALMFVRYLAVIVGTYVFTDNPEAAEALAGAAVAGTALLWAIYARCWGHQKRGRK